MQDDGIGMSLHDDWCHDLEHGNVTTRAYVNVNPRSTTYDVKEEDERDVLVLIKKGGVNLSQMLDNLSPLKVDKKKVGYVTRGSIKKEASNNKTQVLKKKSCSQGKYRKSVDV